jgi:peptide chain release factor 3
MTEKLLLYGGALQQAGAVRMKGEQRATQSDFMEMEKQRGISIRLVLYAYGTRKYMKHDFVYY